MAMGTTYPFDMKWNTYTNKELIIEADRSMSDLDRADLLGLIRELAGRLEDVMNYGPE